jgi:hypothetical protein
MTTIHIVSDNGDLDNGFAAFLAMQVSDTLGEVEVKVVSHATGASAEHRDLVNDLWDRWCALSQAERNEWAD